MDILTQYQAALGSATNVASVLLDMEGGRFILAVFTEALQTLLDDGNYPGATIIAQTLCETADAPFSLATSQYPDILWGIWPELLEEALANSCD